MSEKPYLLAVRAVIVDDEGQCLLVRRSLHNRSFVGTWEWPGGKAEVGEAVDEAVLREVREETGLEIALTGIAGVYRIEMPKQFLAVLCMEAHVVEGTLTLSEEHDDSAWAPLSDLSKWELTAGLREFAEEYAKRWSESR